MIVQHDPFSDTVTYETPEQKVPDTLNHYAIISDMDENTVYSGKKQIKQPIKVESVNNEDYNFKLKELEKAIDTFYSPTTIHIPIKEYQELMDIKNKTIEDEETVLVYIEKLADELTLQELTTIHNITEELTQEIYDKYYDLIFKHTKKGS